jgi:hypothetical protein
MLPKLFKRSIIHFADLNYRTTTSDGDLVSEHLGFFSPFLQEWTRCTISSDSALIKSCQEYARGPISYISPGGLEDLKKSVLTKNASFRPSLSFKKRFGLIFNIKLT